MNKKKWLGWTDTKAGQLLLDSGAYLLGSVLYGLSVNLFTASNDFVPGGVTGIAMLIHYGLPQAPIGLLILLINIPLLLLAWWRIGHGFAIRTAVVTVLSSLLIDGMGLLPFVQPFVAADAGGKILAAVFGGVLMGAGLGIIFARGATTGGSEVIARLLEKRFPYISVGRLLLVVDALVVGASILVYRQLESALYATILIFVTSRVMDAILYGGNAGRMLLIVTHKERETAEAINTRMERGVTMLQASGAYTKQARQVLLCAVRPSEVYELRQLIKEFDPDAFTIVVPTEQVLGEGFHREENQ